MLPETFRCYLVKKTGKDQIDTGVENRPWMDLPAGDLLIQVAYSSINYKDVLATQAHPGVVKKLPHVPGIDAAGTVVESNSAAFRPGDQVLITSCQLGVERWGGWSQYVRVPAAWALPLPPGLSLRESMTLGTAGLTAGLSLRALQHHDVQPDQGEVLVTGATGGVGCLAVMLLAQLGYTVVAVSGKAERVEWLKQLGAARVVGRDYVLDGNDRPLLSATWAGAIDTVGGSMLASVLKSMKHESCVTACGVVAGAEVNTSVYPFILRGVTLRGIDAVCFPMQKRPEVWDMLSQTVNARLPVRCRGNYRFNETL